MLEPFKVDDLSFSESNTEDWLLISSVDQTLPIAGEYPIQAAFIHREQVVNLRDWLNKWLNQESSPLQDSDLLSTQNTDPTLLIRRVNALTACLGAICGPADIDFKKLLTDTEALLIQRGI